SGQQKFASPQQAIGLKKRIEELEMQKRQGVRGGMPPEIPFALGTALLRVGSLDAAERELLEALKARPGYGEAHNNLAAVYVGKGQWKEAAEQAALAQQAGFPVPPRLLDDIRDQKSSVAAAAPPTATPLPEKATPSGPFRVEHDPVACMRANAF